MEGDATYEASIRTFPCISSTLEETTALRPFCDSSLDLMTTNWTEQTESVFQINLPAAQSESERT